MASIISKAPGRICLFGDHQDYLGLPIIACAIDRYITISGLPNGTDFFQFSMPDIEKKVAIRFREPASPAGRSILNPQKGDFLAAALKVVHQIGCTPDQGYNLIITGNIPINAGLSSSSAMVVTWVQWLLTTFGCDYEITPKLIARIAYQAEVIEQNSPGGKMDQYTSAIGHTIYLETDERSFFKTLPQSLEGLVIASSGIAKDTVGLLGHVKEYALEATKKVQTKYSNFRIATATPKDYEEYAPLLSETLRPYFYAAIENHRITKKALKALEEKSLNYTLIGNLMTAHHNVLKNDLKITVPIIDAMITAALDAGAYGAKIVGSGGGGSICALTPLGKEQIICKAIEEAGAILATPVNISKGAHIL